MSSSSHRSISRRNRGKLFRLRVAVRFRICRWSKIDVARRAPLLARRACLPNCPRSPSSHRRSPSVFAISPSSRRSPSQPAVRPSESTQEPLLAEPAALFAERFLRSLPCSSNLALSRLVCFRGRVGVYFFSLVFSCTLCLYLNLD